MARKLTAAALATLALSCAPETQKPMKVRALVLSSNGEYVPTEVELKTVTDIVSMEGQVVRLQGGAHIRMDSEDPELHAARTEEAFGRALLKDAGRPVTANYITDDQGVPWPADFHTWNLVTTYYNFERAWDYFTQVAAMPPAELPRTTAYYFPEFVLADSSDQPQRDNAIFFAPVKAFMVLPFEALQKAPLAINAGIITHEYAHLVFNRRVYDGRALPEPLGNWTGAGLNVIKSLDEGLADFHAYVASCQTSFGCNTRVLATSFEGPSVEDRDLSKSWCMGQELYQQLHTASFSTFAGREYQVGTILASALYKASAASAGDRQVLARAVVAAYSNTDPAKPGLAQLARMALDDPQKFTLARALRAIVQHIPSGHDALKHTVCSNFATHLRIPVTDLSGGEGDCPESTTINDCSMTP
ncbi:hypothetical protein [Archangium sp.]|uniref:hypothetical protein n=1 Tax=Archangium sp. TaxID=1872627 RepID=UPI002D32A64E|nr:hypothetical protein [Archangium sp.]HYO57510.1 hypothetical protein [Archangium sp.]